MYWDASDRRNERSNVIARATFFAEKAAEPVTGWGRYISRRCSVHYEQLIYMYKEKAAPISKPPGGGSVVQYSDSWILMLLMYSRLSPNFSITSIVAYERLKVKMFDQRQVESSVK